MDHILLGSEPKLTLNSVNTVRKKVIQNQIAGTKVHPTVLSAINQDIQMIDAPKMSTKNWQAWP
jgi:hypothetical protein